MAIWCPGRRPRSPASTSASGAPRRTRWPSASTCRSTPRTTPPPAAGRPPATR
jgi:hypothetical protein